MRKTTLAELQEAATAVSPGLKVVAAASRNSRTYATLECSLHGLSDRAANELKRGLGCVTCAAISKANTTRKTLAEWETLARTVHGNRYTYLEVVAPSQSGRQSRLKILCPTHGQFVCSTGNHVSNGSGCPKCAARLIGEKRRGWAKPLDQIKEGLVARGADDIVELRRTPAGVVAERLCERHGRFTTLAHSSPRYGCWDCKAPAQRISKPNLEIAEYLRSLGCQVDLEFRLAGRTAFDLKVDDHLLVEYHGLYWHTTEYREPSHHAQKLKLAQAAGARLIQICSDEWSTRQLQLKMILATAVNRAELPAVNARACTLEEVDSQTAAAFYEANHVQGAVKGGVNYGLAYKGELVALGNFSEALAARRTKSTDTLDLRRYATSKRVRGGLGKLAKFGLNNLKAASLISFSDNRLFTGAGYLAAGFKKDCDLPPDYSYVEKDRRMHKSNYQKSALVKRFGPEFCGNLTEREITEKAGIFRFYDAGKVRWRLTA